MDHETLKAMLTLANARNGSPLATTTIFLLLRICSYSGHENQANEVSLRSERSGGETAKIERCNVGGDCVNNRTV